MWVLLLQLVLLLCWYLVPGVEGLPAWVAFLPLIGIVVFWLIIVAIWAALALRP